MKVVFTCSEIMATKRTDTSDSQFLRFCGKSITVSMKRSLEKWLFDTTKLWRMRMSVVNPRLCTFTFLQTELLTRGITYLIILLILTHCQPSSVQSNWSILLCFWNATDISIIKQNWNQFPLVVKATALKQQISKFYSQIQRTDASDHILCPSVACHKCKS